jgi:hypothetical protein
MHDPETGTRQAARRGDPARHAPGVLPSDVALESSGVGEAVRDLCESAKRGKVCIDDLCRSNPDNTLCGFDQSEYELMTPEYFAGDDFPDDENL